MYSFSKRLKTVTAVLIYRAFFFFIGLTCKKREYGRENISYLQKENKNWIFCTWHNNVSIMVWALKGQKLAMMVSESTDGEMIARVIRAFGNTAVRGSTSKGSIKVFLNMLKLLQKGGNAGITPDGPRGPKYRIQGGTISLAQKTGCPLIPIYTEASRQWTFHKSWDNHKLPKPFSTIVIVYGRPFCVPPQMNKEEFEKIRLEFEAIMQQGTLHTERNVYRYV